MICFFFLSKNWFFYSKNREEDDDLNRWFNREKMKIKNSWLSYLCQKRNLWDFNVSIMTRKLDYFQIDNIYYTYIPKNWRTIWRMFVRRLIYNNSIEKCANSWGWNKKKMNVNRHQSANNHVTSEWFIGFSQFNEFDIHFEPG